MAPTPKEYSVIRMRYLGDLFDPRANSLNALRLCLAVSVVFWHSFPITGTPLDYEPAKQLLKHVGVDGFFAVSGFLIVSSWVRHPDWRDFLRARVLRIFPAFWVCLVLTAAVFAPLSVLISKDELTSGIFLDASGYVARNFLLLMQQYTISGTLENIPLVGVWDGSLWTLLWEFICYLGVLTLGLLGLLRRPATLPVVFIAATVGVCLTSYGPLDNYWIARAAQLGIMFVAGGLVFQFQARIPVSGVTCFLAAVAIVASLWLPDYRIVAAIPLAYLIIALGAVLNTRRLRLRNDFSYGMYIYAFPVQQLLATAGATGLGVTLFSSIAVAITLPIAAASWFLIERPALRLKRKQVLAHIEGEDAQIGPPTNTVP